MSFETSTISNLISTFVIFKELQAPFLPPESIILNSTMVFSSHILE